MSESKLILFYDNLDKLTSFERIRKVYDLTNDLDVYLLRFLRRDFFKYHLLKIKEEVHRLSDSDYQEIENVFEILLSDDVYMYFMEDTLDVFCEVINASFIEDFNNKTILFFPELDELERIGFSKIKNNDVNATKKSTELYDELVDDYSVPLIRRIIYLEKLGVIDFLRNVRPFNTSVNSMANILGSIIDSKPSSIQPLLNPLFSNDRYNKNNPLNSNKNVLAVETHLMKIGYTLKSNNDNKN